MELKYIIEKDEILIKDFLEERGFSRRFRRRAKSNPWFFVNDKEVSNLHKLKKGDVLVIKVKESLNADYPINKTPLNILYEDEYILAVNKPANLSCQPSRKHFSDNLLSMVKYYFQKNNIDGNIHLINRLDYSTSGIVIIGKNGLIHYKLANTQTVKKYLCLVKGSLQDKSGVINLPIYRPNSYDIRRAVDKEGKDALTYYKVLKEVADQSLVEVKLGTGRTHQIRVHFSHLSHPLIGDKLYGDGGELLYLHCYKFKFNHPITNKFIKIVNYPEWIKGDSNA